MFLVADTLILEFNLSNKEKQYLFHIFSPCNEGDKKIKVLNPYIENRSQFSLSIIIMSYLWYIDYYHPSSWCPLPTSANVMQETSSRQASADGIRSQSERGVMAYNSADDENPKWGWNVIYVWFGHS